MSAERLAVFVDLPQMRAAGVQIDVETVFASYQEWCGANGLAKPELEEFEVGLLDAGYLLDGTIDEAVPAPAMLPRIPESDSADWAITLPVRLDEEDDAMIVDALGREVCVIDVDRKRTDDQAIALSRFLRDCINAAGKVEGA